MHLPFKFVVVIVSLLTIGCGGSTTDTPMNQKQEAVIVNVEPVDLLTTLTSETTDYDIQLDDTDSYSGNQSLKLMNQSGCITLPVIQEVSVKALQGYELSFAIKRTGERDYLDGCPPQVTIETWQETKAGIPLYIGHGLEIDIAQSGTTLLNTSHFLDEADMWEHVILSFSTVSNDPVSVSFKCGYELFWLDTLQITELQ